MTREWLGMKNEWKWKMNVGEKVGGTGVLRGMVGGQGERERGGEGEGEARCEAFETEPKSSVK